MTAALTPPGRAPLREVGRTADTQALFKAPLLMGRPGSKPGGCPRHISLRDAADHAVLSLWAHRTTSGFGDLALSGVVDTITRTTRNRLWCTRGRSDQ